MHFKMYGDLKLDHYAHRLAAKRDRAIEAMLERAPDEMTGRIEYMNLTGDVARHIRGGDSCVPHTFNHRYEEFAAWHVFCHSSTDHAHPRGLITACDLPGRLIETIYDRVIAGQTPYFVPPQEPIRQTLARAEQKLETASSWVLSPT